MMCYAGMRDLEYVRMSQLGWRDEKSEKTWRKREHKIQRSDMYKEGVYG